MLRKETVTAGTLEVLKSLMLDESLRDFYLVGGTALSLQIGHRISIDLDFFSEKPFDSNRLLEHLESFYQFISAIQSKNTLKGKINGIQVDFITHAYPSIIPLNIIEDIRIANLENIGAMKLNAIAGNVNRLKDFIDVAYLSCFLSLDQILSAHEAKYASRNPLAVIKSLTYFHDINFEEPVQMITRDFMWLDIENRINEMVAFPDKIFDLLP